MGKPLLRLGLAFGIGLVTIAMVYAAFFIPQSPLAGIIKTPTYRWNRTMTPTLSESSELGTKTPTFIAPTPLWMLLGATYTPTAAYVSTQHSVTSRDAYDAGIRYLRNRDYQNAIALMEQLLDMEPVSRRLRS